MARIWAYGDSHSKTATGKKWHGNVIAVPNGYELGKVYLVSYTENGITKSFEALAVDKAPGTFAAPKNSELFQHIKGRNVEVKLKTNADAGTDVKPQKITAPVQIAALDVQPVPPDAASKLEAAKAFTEAEGIEMAQVFNQKGIKNPNADQFACAGCIQGAPDQAPAMAKVLIEKYPQNPAPKLSTLLAIFKDNPPAQESIIKEYEAYATNHIAPSLPANEAIRPVSNPTSDKPVTDQELAAFLVQNTSVKNMTCNSCIVRERGHLPEFITAIDDKGTPAHMAELQAILQQTDKQIQDVRDSNKKPNLKAGAESLPPSGSFTMPEKFRANAMLGLLAGGTSNGFSGVTPFGQGAAEFSLTEDTKLKAALSLRPTSTKDGAFGPSKLNLLELNWQRNFKDDSALKLGASTWVANPSYALNPFKTTTTLSCGCTVPANANETAVALVDGALAPVLHEKTIIGATYERNFDDTTFLRLGAGLMPRDNNLLKLNPAVLAAIRHNFNETNTGSLTLVAQPNQINADIGGEHRFSDDTSLSGDLYANYGEQRNIGVEARLKQQKLFGQPRLAGAITAGAEIDTQQDKTSAFIRPVAAVQVNKNTTFTISGIAGEKDGKKNVGGAALFSISF